MALALNNLKRVDMPLNKETKPNHNFGIDFSESRSDFSKEFSHLHVGYD